MAAANRVEAVIEPFSDLPCPVNGHGSPSPPPALHRDDFARLARSLLDVRTSLESDLRTLTSMQRSLERVRERDGRCAEAELLLRERARQLETLEQTSAGLTDRLRAAGYELEVVRRI